MRTNRRDYISTLLASLHWLPFKSRIEFKIFLLTYKALNDQAPSYRIDLTVLPAASLADILFSFKTRLKTFFFVKAHS